MQIRARTLTEVKTKQKLLLSLIRAMTLLMIVVLIGWMGILGASLYTQFYHEPYGRASVPGQIPRSWAGGVFRIEVVKKGLKTNYGTGFCIGRQLVVTNAHVVGKAGITVRLYTDAKKESMAGKVLWVGNYKNNPRMDIAVINLGKKGKRLKKQVVETTNKPLKPGDAILALGFNLGRENMSYLKGYVTSLSRTDKLIQHDASVNMGCSGGPLISSNLKKVVGIIVAEEDAVMGKRVVTGTKLAIPIRDVIKNIPSKYRAYIGHGA